jgi:class 3 adenylate cyclase/tetratricopeptide (TPR) repeat protein
MQCEACGEDNPAVNRFCQGCGTPLAIACTECDQICPPGAAFCGACGAELRPHRSASAFARRTSRRAPVARGELKQVTVLFADIVSSTELVARLDAEAAMRRLKPALDTMCEAVDRFDGTVVHTMGDGIVALFGAPLAQEGHAVLACQAAIAIRDAFRLSEGNLFIRVGLHSGEVVADAPLTDTISEPGAYGMTLHLGSRLPHKIEPGGICITEGCLRLVHSICDVEPIGRHTLRGVPEPVELFRLMGLKPAVASQRFRGVSLSSFRGRGREMSMLRRKLLDVEAGAGSVIGVIGAPGSGKSRLCYEFAEWCRGRMIPVYEARAHPYGAATPLRPVLEFLRSAYFRISPDDEPQSAISTIAERLREIGATAEVDLPLVCDFLGVPCEDGPPAWLNPRGRNSRLLDIIRRMVRHRGVTTSIIVIEDLHWLDEASEKFVAAVVDEVAATRTLLVVNFRPGYFASWMGAPHYQPIDLGELDSSDTVRLVDELIGSHPEVAEIRERIAARSGGNPFFAEELVRSMVDNAVLIGMSGDYRRGMTTSAAVLPATVQAVIGARIDRLTQRDRDLLQIGAIIGKEFQFSILQNVASQDSENLEPVLDHLCMAGLLQHRSSPDGRGYEFCHPLIQEVAYTTQLKDRRSTLHGAVARAIEQFQLGPTDEFAALLSYHFDEAGEVRSAADYAARAARWVGYTSPTEAIKHWHKVRSLMASEPRARESDALRIEASGQIAWLGWREGLTTEQARPFIQEALAWAQEIDDSIIPLLRLFEARIAQVSGGSADALAQTLERVISHLEPVRDAGRIATLSAALSHAYGWAGLLREALAANDAALAGVSEVTDLDHQFLGYSVEHWALALRGRLLLRLGQFDAARSCFDHMLGIQELLDPTVEFIAHFGYVDLAWCLDDASMAAEHAMQIAAIATRQGSAYLRVYCLAAEGIAECIARNFDRAIDTLAEGIQFLREAKAAMEFEPEMLASLAFCLAQTGAHDRAIEVAKETVAMARQRSSRLPECRASITLATVLLTAIGAEAQEEAAALLDTADTLIRVTGASIYERHLEEARLLSGTLPAKVAEPRSVSASCAVPPA